MNRHCMKPLSSQEFGKVDALDACMHGTIIDPLSFTASRFLYLSDPFLRKDNNIIFLAYDQTIPYSYASRSEPLLLLFVNPLRGFLNN